MPRVTELYAYVMADTGPDDEGVPAFLGPDGAWMPMIGADMERAEQLRERAQVAATAAGKPIKLVRSTALEVVETLEPGEGPVFRTRTGRLLTDSDFQALADEAERGYDVSQFVRRGSPAETSPDAPSEPLEAHRAFAEWLVSLDAAVNWPERRRVTLTEIIERAKALP